MAIVQWYGWEAHMLPGRLRVRLPLLRGRQDLAGRLQARLGCAPGVQSAVANPVTGSVLVHYNPRVMDPDRLAGLLGLNRRPPASRAPGPDARLAAASALMAAAGLALVAGKRRLLGPSLLSRDLRSWDVAGLVTVAASYPFLRRGVQGTLAGRGLNADLTLGLAGLAATVMRENVLGLAVLTLSGLTQWLFARTMRECRDQTGVALSVSDSCAGHHRSLVEAGQRSAHRWGTLALGAAAAAGVLTGDWRRALAVLVAAAPAAVGQSATLPFCAATAAAARQGVLVKGPEAVAAAGHIDILSTGPANSVLRLQRAGRRVAVVGTDPEALRAADLGVSAAQNPKAREAADAMLAGGDVRTLLALGREAVGVAHRGRRLAVAMNLAGLALAATGLAGPLGASLWHNVTSLLAVLGALRVFRAPSPGRY